MVDDHEMTLLNSPAELQNMNIFSRAGRNFYQALTQLISSIYGIVPQEGSYADSLVVRQEDIARAKLQKMAKEYGIGFLENDEDILAVEVDDGTEKTLLLENYAKTGEQESHNDNDELAVTEETEWAELEEITFDDEIAYMERGIEFVASMEELEKVNNSGEEMPKAVPKEGNNKVNEMSAGNGLLRSIRRVLGLRSRG